MFCENLSWKTLFLFSISSKLLHILLAWKSKLPVLWLVVELILGSASYERLYYLRITNLFWLFSSKLNANSASLVQFCVSISSFHKCTFLHLKIFSLKVIGFFLYVPLLELALQFSVVLWLSNKMCDHFTTSYL